MPRAARFVLPDLALHVIQRGNNRASCFFREADCAAYLGYLRFYSMRFGCSVHAYCLMTNHVHLLMTPHRADACALVMKYLGQCYVQYVNKTHGRTGTLWEGRFRSCLVGSEHYALACYRYIELNPVRARIVARPREYRWSSYGANAEGRRDELITPHPAYCGLAEDPARRNLAYAGLFDTSLEESVIEEIRKATRGGFLVGRRRRGRGRPPGRYVPAFES